MGVDSGWSGMGSRPTKGYSVLFLDTLFKVPLPTQVSKWALENPGRNHAMC